MTQLDKQIENFWQKINKNGTIPHESPELGKCWLWIGRSRKGYGQFFFQGKNQRANRVAWYLSHGEYPIHFACHKCNNKSCVNPSHLYDGTNEDNMKDMANEYKRKRKLLENFYINEERENKYNSLISIIKDILER